MWEALNSISTTETKLRKKNYKIAKCKLYLGAFDLLQRASVLPNTTAYEERNDS